MCVPEQYPLENYHTQLLQVSSAHRSMMDIPSGWSAEDIYLGMAWIDEHFAFIQLPEDNPTMEQIIALTKIEILRRGCQGLVIDPFNELRHPKTQWAAHRRVYQ